MTIHACKDAFVLYSPSLFSPSINFHLPFLLSASKTELYGLWKLAKVRVQGTLAAVRFTWIRFCVQNFHCIADVLVVSPDLTQSTMDWNLNLLETKYYVPPRLVQFDNLPKNGGIMKVVGLGLDWYKICLKPSIRGLVQ